jgi:hypothetical protein
MIALGSGSFISSAMARVSAASVFVHKQRCVLQLALLSWQAAIYSASSERSFVLCVTACDVER